MKSPLLALALSCFDTAFDRGWWDGEKNPETGKLDPEKVWAIVPEKLTLIHSEISEALEDFRIGKMETEENEKGKPCGFHSELADVAIRIFDLAGALEVDLLGAQGVEALQDPPMKPSIRLAFIHREISDALTAWEAGNEGGKRSLVWNLSVALWMTECRPPHLTVPTGA